MIVAMKKVDLVVLDKSRRESLESLRRVGVLHLENLSGSSEALAELEAKKALLEKALLLLPKVKSIEPLQPPSTDGMLEQALEQARSIVEMDERCRESSERRERMRREVERLAAWGDFDPQTLSSLRDKGIDVRLYEASPDAIKNIPKESRLFFVGRDKRVVRLAVVLLAGEQAPDLEEFALPAIGQGSLYKKIAEEEELQASLTAKIAAWAPVCGLLQEGIEALQPSIDFEKARIGMGVEGSLAYLRGYLPVKKLEELKKAASFHGWALLVQDPGEEDPVPTLVENPRWIRIIEPVFQFLDINPGYRETDISLWFLVFFSVFFAMLVGDAVYGVIFLAISIWARRKLPQAPPQPFVLMYLLSVCTMVWGALTGTWLGSEALGRSPALSWMVIPSLSSFAEDNTALMMKISFTIGIVHLSLAKILAFICGLPRLKAFSELGWVMILIGMYFQVLTIVLREPMVFFSLYLLLAGLILVVVFAEQKGRFLKGVGMGLAWLPMRLLDSVSAFANIISYVRLYAVGLAGVAVSSNFNTMLMGQGFHFPAGLAAAVILFAAHALNIAMCCMAVLVHGVRLNVLEFSMNLGMSWSGIPYKPFKES